MTIDRRRITSSSGIDVSFEMPKAESVAKPANAPSM